MLQSLCINTSLPAFLVRSRLLKLLQRSFHKFSFYKGMTYMHETVKTCNISFIMNQKYVLNLYYVYSQQTKYLMELRCNFYFMPVFFR